jgi:CrcB protein
MTTPGSFGLVFLGAGLGGALRHAVNMLALRVIPSGLPIGTLAVNLIGSFAAGAVAGYLMREGRDSEQLRFFALTGVIGGFTTFSAYSLEVVNLMQRGSIGMAIGYALGSVIISAAAVLAGLALLGP